MKKLVKSALNFSRLSVPQKIEKARSVVSLMTNNDNFKTPLPALKDVSTAADDLEESFLASRDGSRTSLKETKEKEVALQNLMAALHQYVQFTANLDPDTAESVITGAGIDIRTPKASSSNEFEVENTEKPGKVRLRTKAATRAGYIWEYSLADDPAKVWTQSNVTMQAKVFVDGLQSMKQYLFRVAVVDKDGQGPWSHELKLLVA